MLPLAQEICAEYQEKAQAKQQILLTEWNSKHAFILADALRVRQVFENLLSNALKFSPIQSQIRVSLGRENEQFVFRISDQGPGLSEAEQALLFEKFMRLTPKPTAGEHSSGLGLSISKKLVEAMSGSIGCESQLGQGSCFFVTFPPTSPP